MSKKEKQNRQRKKQILSRSNRRIGKKRKIGPLKRLGRFALLANYRWANCLFAIAKILYIGLTYQHRIFLSDLGFCFCLTVKWSIDPGANVGTL